MPHKASVHTALTIKLFLERKDDQGLVDVVANQPYPPLPPSPELRGDVIHSRNATLLHLPCYPPIKCRRIDDDGEIGLATVGLRDQVLVESKNLRQMIENFSDADHGKIFGIDHGFTAGSPHPLATDPEKIQSLCRDSRPRLSGGAKLHRLLLPGAPQSLNQLRPIHFSGCLSGGDENEHRAL